MIFKNETGIILDSNFDTLHIIDGYASHVKFYAEVVLKFHKLSPGLVFLLAHTHPDGMTELSLEDQTTLKAFAITLAPFPVRMATVTQVAQDLFKTTIYLSNLQSSEDYLYKKQTGKRNFEIIKEVEGMFSTKDEKGLEPWEKIIIERSYMQENIN